MTLYWQSASKASYHLFQAISLFNASYHDEAARRVQDLTTACQHVDTLPGTVVEVSFFLSQTSSFIILNHAGQSYLRVQRGMITFENGGYSDSADQFLASIHNVTDLTSRRTLLEPRMKIFTMVCHYKAREYFH